jgi:hypothetical protein
MIPALKFYGNWEKEYSKVKSAQLKTILIKKHEKGTSKEKISL